MAVAESHTKNFNDAVAVLSEQYDCITTYAALKDFAKYNIDRDCLFLAEHILNALRDTADYYDYDYSLGTLDTPTPLRHIADLEDYCEEDEQ